ncbi:hypothetical protein FDI21_gp277 [Pseudomonas phage Noxifer]|uniref:Uncharacterized protein n=1 Tax=Pseudomonas phage Noxifer TaxID=2006684 RepID=A0A1Y0SXS9_9CAUD|nr:hypothetical protein FDI21_gp277 [Pseudomonas phage Noxifer]ARV77434.1 hypothetical protein NOXIFER_269 [Pseudomonas phage Noxifer]
MCFKQRYLVDAVDEPDVTQKFQLFRSDGPLGKGPSARDRIDIVISVWLNHQLVTKVLEIADTLSKRKWVVGEHYPVVPERGVLFASPAVKHLFPKFVAHDEVMFLTPDVRMDGKIIMLQLSDFSYLQMVSVSYRETTECYIEAEVRLKFGLKADRSTFHTYKHP